MLAVPLLSRGLASSISLDSRAGCKRSPRRRSWNSHSFIRQWLAGLRKRRFFPSGNLFSGALSPGEKAVLSTYFHEDGPLYGAQIASRFSPFGRFRRLFSGPRWSCGFRCRLRKRRPTCVGRRCLKLASRFSCELARRKLLRRNVSTISNSDRHAARQSTTYSPSVAPGASPPSSEDASTERLLSVQIVCFPNKLKLA